MILHKNGTLHHPFRAVHDAIPGIEAYFGRKEHLGEAPRELLDVNHMGMDHKALM